MDAYLTYLSEMPPRSRETVTHLHEGYAKTVDPKAHRRGDPRLRCSITPPMEDDCPDVDVVGECGHSDGRHRHGDEVRSSASVVPTRTISQRQRDDPREVRRPVRRTHMLRLW